MKQFIVITVGLMAAFARPAFSGGKQWVPTPPPLMASAERAAAPAPQGPYRTFVHVKHYYIENLSSREDAISNVRLEMSFPNGTDEEGTKVTLPEAGQYWPIGKGQIQEINRVFEIPASQIKNDGFRFKIQMVRKGSPMLPCEFSAQELSDHNSSFVCKVDLNWQIQQGIAEADMDKEGIQVRVFTDRNSPKSEIPSNAIALGR